jgi:regulator of cell morphogenesis and NO signaling
MAQTKATGSIVDFFERDHREIDAILSGVDFDSPQRGLPLFEEFDRRLERHIKWEEELLFPAVGAASPGLEQGPLFVMCEEHKRIRAEKAAALAALRAADGLGAKTHAGRMVEILGQHNMKEERILYPACDEVLTAQDRLRILTEVRS